MDYFIGAEVGQLVGSGEVQWDASTEDAPDGVLSYDSGTNRIEIPTGTTLDYLQVSLTWTTPSASGGTLVVNILRSSDDTDLMQGEAFHPAGSTFLLDEFDEDLVVVFGSWPFTAPEPCYLLVFLTLGGGALTYDLESGFIDIDFTPGRRARWWAGVAGSG